MKQPTGQKRSAWFWVGVTLLSLSVLFWLMITLTMISDPGFDVVELFVIGLMFTAIPLGIGIYSVRRSRKAQDTGAEIVFGVSEGLFWFGLLVLLFGILIILLGLDEAGLSLGFALADKNLGGGLALIGTGLGIVLFGIWMMGLNTKVMFDQASGHMTITRGAIPVFLWFLRTKRISREELRSALGDPDEFIVFDSVPGPSKRRPYIKRPYNVEVVKKLVEKLTWVHWTSDKEEQLVQGIFDLVASDSHD